MKLKIDITVCVHIKAFNIAICWAPKSKKGNKVVQRETGNTSTQMYMYICKHPIELKKKCQGSCKLTKHWNVGGNAAIELSSLFSIKLQHRIIDHL